jgi:hypothetical protein
MVDFKLQSKSERLLNGGVDLIPMFMSPLHLAQEQNGSTWYISTVRTGTVYNRDGYSNAITSDHR